MDLELGEISKKHKTDRKYIVMKRFFDIMLSLIGIIILIPLFVIIGIAIKIDSKGPVFFKQERYGKNKKAFYIYKFRTMFLETPTDVATRDLINSKKYITKMGALLRKTSIDELPQLYNILLGEMSIVGPRPVVIKEKKLIIERDKYGANNIKPGITGWAQVNGRDKLSVEEKAELDGFYVDNIGMLMDIKCFFKTIKHVIKCEDIVEGGDEININHI